MSGKKFSDAIKDARRARKKFIRFSNILINIQTDQTKVTISDFTKQRFLAACHMELFGSGFADDFCSPLVTRINFGPHNPLSDIKALLGAGFQFLGDVVAKTQDNINDGILLFHLGCLALDYIRKSSPSKDVATGLTMRPELDPTRYDFTDYIISDSACEGDTFVAGCRNLDQSSLTVLDKNKQRFCEMAVNVDIGKYGGSVKDRVAGNFASMQDEFKDTIQKLKGGVSRV